MPEFVRQRETQSVGWHHAIFLKLQLMPLAAGGSCAMDESTKTSKVVTQITPLEAMRAACLITSTTLFQICMERPLASGCVGGID
jgi:hypothetical protein